jgi:hypothetical protein
VKVESDDTATLSDPVPAKPSPVSGVTPFIPVMLEFDPADMGIVPNAGNPAPPDISNEAEPEAVIPATYVPVPGASAMHIPDGSLISVTAAVTVLVPNL